MNGDKDRLRPFLGRGMLAGLAVALMGILLSACAPAIHAPSPVGVRPPAMAKTVTTMQGAHPLHPGPWPEQDWWQGLQVAQLDGLLHHALTHSPQIMAAQSELDWAAAMGRLHGAALGTQINGAATIAPMQFSGNGPFGALGLGNKRYDSGDIGLGFSQALDFWGKRRYLWKDALGEERAANARLADTRRLLAGAIVRRYLDWCLSSRQYAQTESLLGLAEKRLQLAETRQRLGLSSQIPLTRQRQRVATLQVLAERWAGLADGARADLAELAATDPDTLPMQPEYPQGNVLPALPPHLRLDLLAHRPDVRAARDAAAARMAGTCAARAEFYPDVSFSALLDLDSASLATLLNPASFAYALGPAIHLPIFTSGALHARLHAAEARQSEAVAIYEQTVLRATRQVLTALSAWTSETGQWAAQRRAARSVAQRAVLVERRRALGVDDETAVLSQQEGVIQQQMRVDLLHYGGLRAWAELETALGGGYGHP
ncbi:efflux transporter outer membrane subunit [Acidithiobacillus sulfuriphilus]|uniref:Efflux transporter outer membrane subunit n=2 Tax=Acidithiobacillus sulfuriphilus TaxID=1867749 RepID=A0ACD5HNV7_9PROT|nr:efflux transporter outer membrane subunit [Acidithiobacillus sulfuriphilus]